LPFGTPDAGEGGEHDEEVEVAREEAVQVVAQSVKVRDSKAASLRTMAPVTQPLMWGGGHGAGDVSERGSEGGAVAHVAREGRDVGATVVEGGDELLGDGSSGAAGAREDDDMACAAVDEHV